MPFTYRDKPKLADRLRGKSGEEIFNELKSDFDPERRRMFFDSPTWRTGQNISSGFPRGFPFDDDRDRVNIRTYLDDIAARHPQFADQLKEPPWGDDFVNIPFGRSGRSPNLGTEQIIRVEPSGSAQPPSQPQQEQQQQEEVREPRQNLTNFGLRNTVPLGPGALIEEDRRQRSMSAPPDSRVDKSKKAIPKCENPVMHEPTHGTAQAKPNFSLQGGPESQKQNTSPNVRVIPIQVEGRDAPVVHTNIDNSASFGYDPFREALFEGRLPRDFGNYQRHSPRFPHVDSAGSPPNEHGNFVNYTKQYWDSPPQQFYPNSQQSPFAHFTPHPTPPSQNKSSTSQSPGQQQHQHYYEQRQQQPQQQEHHQQPQQQQHRQQPLQQQHRQQPQQQEHHQQPQQQEHHQQPQQQEHRQQSQQQQHRQQPQQQEHHQQPQQQQHRQQPQQQEHHQQPQQQQHRQQSQQQQHRQQPQQQQHHQQPQQQQHHQQPQQQQQHRQQSQQQQHRQQSQQQQHHQQPQQQQQQQQQGHPKQEETNSKPPPQAKPEPIKDPIEKVQVIQKEVKELMKQVENFIGNSRKDKQYLTLDELLTRQLLLLDNIDTEGKENVRQARKDAIRNIQRCINTLESKVPLPGNEMSKNVKHGQEEKTKANESGESQKEKEVVKLKENKPVDITNQHKMDVAHKGNKPPLHTEEATKEAV